MNKNEMWVRMTGLSISLVLIALMLLTMFVHFLLESPATLYIRVLKWLFAWPASLLYAAINFSTGQGWVYVRPNKLGDHITDVMKGRASE